MRVQLGSASQKPGVARSFEWECDFSFARLGLSGRFLTPVKLTGVVTDHAGVLTLDYTVEFTLLLVCGRCLCEIERDFSLEFSHLLALSEPGDDSEAVFCPGGVLDMEALSVDDILLELPQRALCSPDCAGLCPVCGANRNSVDCGHDGDGSPAAGGDPRWAALRSLNITGDEN